MNIKLRFFASVREILGVDAETVSLPSDAKTVGDVRRFLMMRGDKWAEALAEGKSLRMAINQQMCDASALISDGAEVAFFPPVTGG